LGCTSLFDYTMRNLRYSEDQAQKRIVAMRLMKDMPEIENKIANGTVSLAVLSLLYSHIRRERMSTKSEKLILVEEIEGMTKRAAERFLISKSSSPIYARRDKARALANDLTELRFVVHRRTEEKIGTLKGHLAHKKPNVTLGELLDLLCDWGLEKVLEIQPCPGRVTPHQPLRAQVFIRDQNKCTHCGSQHALEIDHIIPKAKGGLTNLENLRLLCRNCNQRAAINEYGMKKMERYLQ